MKTSELTGLALDWAVAKCEGEEAELNHGEIVTWKYVNGQEYRLVWQPSTNWAQGGPIIEREDIQIKKHISNWIALPESAEFSEEQYQEGETPLIAAMRCYVASKLGDEVEIPNELVEGL